MSKWIRLSSFKDTNGHITVEARAGKVILEISKSSPQPPMTPEEAYLLSRIIQNAAVDAENQ